MLVNAMTDEFEHIEIFGKPALFTNTRVDKETVPKGWYRYNIRGSDRDPGSFGTREREVVVNHAGTILLPEEIPFPKGKEYKPIRGSQNFLGEENDYRRVLCLSRPSRSRKPSEISGAPRFPQGGGAFLCPDTGTGRGNYRTSQLRQWGAVRVHRSCGISQDDLRGVALSRHQRLPL